MIQIEEKILINEIRKRNREVFEALFSEYYPVLTRYAEGFLFDRDASEDIVQSIFVYFWENAGSMELKTSLKAYLYGAVKNKCLNYLRDMKVRDKHNLLYLEAILNSDNKIDWIEPEIGRKIKEAIDKLPERMKEIITQKYLQGKKINEISENLDISENTVKTQLNRAKRKLKSQLLDLTSLNFIL